MFKTVVSSSNEPESSWLPAGLSPVIDAHVHVFPVTNLAPFGDGSMRTIG